MNKPLCTIAGICFSLLSFSIAAQNSGRISGACAGIINTSNIYSALIESNGKSIDREGNNLAIKINFDSNNIELINNNYDISSNPYKTKIFSAASTFVMTDSIRMSGAKLLVFAVVDEYNEKFNMELTLIPVNSNNTFFIQGVNVGFSGVCQKV